MEYETEDEEVMKTATARTNSARPDVSSVFMALARRALADSDKTGIPQDEELKRLAKWCELYRSELYELSKIQKDPESRQRRIWLHELASMPPGRWADMRIRLFSFIRLFGLPPRSQSMPFMSAEAKEVETACRSNQTKSHASDLRDLRDGSNEGGGAVMAGRSSEGSFSSIGDRFA
jgi:hypothetical protein